MYGTRTRGRHPAAPNESQIWIVASVYKFKADFPRPTSAMHNAVGVASNVVYLDCLLDLQTGGCSCLQL